MCQTRSPLVHPPALLHTISSLIGWTWVLIRTGCFKLVSPCDVKIVLLLITCLKLRNVATKPPLTATPSHQNNRYLKIPLMCQTRSLLVHSPALLHTISSLIGWMWVLIWTGCFKLVSPWNIQIVLLAHHLLEIEKCGLQTSPHSRP